jgi:hypothetical protein
VRGGKKLNKKTILMTLVIATALFVGSFPTIISHYTFPDQPGLDSWVVTDEVEDIDVDEHTFYSERIQGSGTVDEHEQVWFTDPEFPHPISEDNTWINTEIICSASVSGDDVILRIETAAISGGGAGKNYYSENIDWVVINGNQLSANLSVTASWYKWRSGQPPLYCEETEYVGFDDGDYGITLSWAQAVDLEFGYCDGTISPGQKDYWIETDYDTYEGKGYKYVTIPDTNQGFYSSHSSNDHNLTWWTDKDPYFCPLYQSTNWHINTKALIWVTAVSTNDLRVSVKVYGESNYNPETVNWTIIGGNDPGAYFHVQIDTEDDDLNITIDKDDEDYYQVLGVIADPMDLDITWYES